jgi:amino acid transporter
MTGYAVIFIWVAVVVRQRVGQDPSLFPRVSAMETVGRIMFYILTLSLWVGSVALWKTSRPGVEKSSRRSPTEAMYVGGSVGIVLGLLFSARDVQTMGWGVFPGILFLELVVYSLICLFLAAVWFKEPGKKLFRAKWPRLSIRSLLAIIAYLCLLLGLGVSTARLGQKARLYHERFFYCNLLIPIYEKGASTIPGAEPDFRKIIDYLTLLAAKYDRSRKEPWIDVSPDPPFPVAGHPALPWQ